MRFEEIFNAHKDKVFSLCFRYLQQEQEAEDALQDIFVKIYLKRDSFREEARISTWIYRITVNHCLDIIKSRKRKQQLIQMVSFLPFIGEIKAAKDLSLEEKDAAARLYGKLLQLPDSQFTALVLNKLEGIPIEKVALIMKTSYKAVESLLQRGKAKPAKTTGPLEGLSVCTRLIICAGDKNVVKMKKTMDIEEVLELLSQKRPGKSNIAFKELMVRIGEVNRARAPKSLVLAALCLLVLTVSFDVIMIRNSKKVIPKQNLIQEMSLMNNSSIYGSL